MYQSTYEALEYLYPKLSTGGYVLVDDYGSLDPCKQAVEDYRDKHSISGNWSGRITRKYIGGGLNNSAREYPAGVHLF